MNQSDEKLITNLIEQNNELKELWENHNKYKQKLKKIDRKPFLNPQEKMEKKRVELAKLAGRTRIETILNDYRVHSAS